MMAVEWSLQFAGGAERLGAVVVVFDNLRLDLVAIVDWGAVDCLGVDHSKRR